VVAGAEGSGVVVEGVVDEGAGDEGVGDEGAEVDGAGAGVVVSGSPQAVKNRVAINDTVNNKNRAFFTLTSLNVSFR
jgi:hypothetical protein